MQSLEETEYAIMLHNYKYDFIEDINIKPCKYDSYIEEIYNYRLDVIKDVTNKNIVADCNVIMLPQNWQKQKLDKFMLNINAVLIVDRDSDSKLEEYVKIKYNNILVFKLKYPQYCLNIFNSLLYLHSYKSIKTINYINDFICI